MHDSVIRFIDCHVPVMLCNFTCEYCSVAQKKGFGAKFKPLPYSAQHIARALSKERLGGKCALNMCGNGETLLHPELLPLIHLLLQEGHYVSIVTNGTAQNAMDELFALPLHLRELVFIKFSFHYLELKQRGLLQRYIKNVKNAKLHGLSFTVELVGAECNIPFIDEIKKCCMENFGALCHVTDPRSMVKEGLPRLAVGNLEDHQKLWGQFNSGLFDYRQATWGKNRRKDFCYAGEFSFCLSLASGILFQCNKGKLQNIFENINEPIHFMACGSNCPFPHCFNSHVYDCFAGVIPEMNSPTYAHLRNRVCADGSEWLSPKYKALYSERICNHHTEYDERRKKFTNGVMALTYGNGEIDPEFANIVRAYLSEAGIAKCALYGDNELSRWLHGNIEGLVFLDDESVSDVDAVIVSDYQSIAQSRQLLSTRVSTPIVDVRDLHSIRIGEN